jgi:hypothetical protein
MFTKKKTLSVPVQVKRHPMTFVSQVLANKTRIQEAKNRNTGNIILLLDTGNAFYLLKGIVS